MHYCLFRNFSLILFSTSDSNKDKPDEKEMIFGIVTRIDLLNFITLNQKENGLKNGELH